MYRALTRWAHWGLLTLCFGWALPVLAQDKANAALAYMAEVGDADGVIALAPGHSPEFTYRRGLGKDAVDTARSWVGSGKGADMLHMADMNQGKQQTISMGTPNVAAAQVLQWVKTLL